jgi:hypothetical protein
MTVLRSASLSHAGARVRLVKTRELWLGIASATGLIVMLLGEGAVDALGLLIAIAPVAHGLGAALMRRRHL